MIHSSSVLRIGSTPDFQYAAAPDVFLNG